MVFIRTRHSKKWSTFLKQDVNKATAEGIEVILTSEGEGGGERESEEKGKGAFKVNTYRSGIPSLSFSMTP